MQVVLEVKCVGVWALLKPQDPLVAVRERMVGVYVKRLGGGVSESSPVHPVKERVNRARLHGALPSTPTSGYDLGGIRAVTRLP